MVKLLFGEVIPADMTSPIYTEGDWKLTALIFFDPKFANSEEIIDMFSLLDVFSGEHLNIHMKGFSTSPPREALQIDLTEVHTESETYYYSAKNLLKDVEELEKETTWRFSMEIDVILLRQKRWSNRFESGTHSSYGDVITLNLYQMLRDKKISSYASFFSELIQFAKEYDGDNPVWDVSDHKLWAELKKSLFESFKKYMGFRNFHLKVEDYAIKDIRK